MAGGGGDGGGITGRIVGQDGHRAHLVRNRSHLPAWVPPAEGAAAVETADVVVVGGGVAGLVAAWRLASSGVFDGAGGGTNMPGRATARPRPRPRVVVLELEDQAGGNSLPGFDPASGLRYPWGAHLVPVPSTVGPGAHAKSSARVAVYLVARGGGVLNGMPWGAYVARETRELLDSLGGLLGGGECDRQPFLSCSAALQELYPTSRHWAGGAPSVRAEMQGAPVQGGPVPRPGAAEGCSCRAPRGGRRCRSAGGCCPRLRWMRRDGASTRGS
eukprot:COSAG01_NODE_6115_length_3843_cov_1.972489_1_plen_273_part_00